MRINSQNNQFIFNLPQGMITKDIEDKFQILLDKNFIPYDNVMDYVNSTIKMVFSNFDKERKFHSKKNLERSGLQINLLMI